MSVKNFETVDHMCLSQVKVVHSWLEMEPFFISCILCAMSHVRAIIQHEFVKMRLSPKQQKLYTSLAQSQFHALSL